MVHADYLKLADLYATLNPSAHIGKQPACTDTIIASGIRRVFIESKDPNPSVIGNRIRLLRTAGFKVISDLCKKEADFSNRAYFDFILLHNPFPTTRLPHGGKNPLQIILNRHHRTPKVAIPIHALLPIGGVS
ncbi:hypothetical protein AB1K89_00835 [Sporosarcina sp. 179-K 8C2 HS]|uniref:hypothetical protein n=1 Tax=Sporosarcina sp. 179-K 8C2 HS TaxID=3142387 RepID=UPI0039A20AD6